MTPSTTRTTATSWSSSAPTSADRTASESDRYRRQWPAEKRRAADVPARHSTADKAPEDGRCRAHGNAPDHERRPPRMTSALDNPVSRDSRGELRGQPTVRRHRSETLPSRSARSIASLPFRPHSCCLTPVRRSPTRTPNPRTRGSQRPGPLVMRLQTKADTHDHAERVVIRSPRAEHPNPARVAGQHAGTRF